MASNEHSNKQNKQGDTQQELLKDMVTIPVYPADYSIMEDLAPSELPMISDAVSSWTCKTCKVDMVEQGHGIYKCPNCGWLDW